MEDFESLLSVGNLLAISYALVGIHALRPDRLKELSRNLQNPKAEVVVQSGCIEYRESLASVLKRIETGSIQRESSSIPVLSSHGPAAHP